MSGEVHDECGIAAVSLKENGDEKGLYILYKLLLNLQNRGQLSAGVSTVNPERKQILDTLKDIGTVNEVFRTSRDHMSRTLFKRYAGNKGVGHVRYATFGKNEKLYAQPFERHHGRLWKWFAFGFNGNLVNYWPLRESLGKEKDYHFTLENDTEIIMHYISKQFTGNKKPQLKTVFTNLSKEFEGSYNLSFINAQGEVAVVRDPLGFRPLAYTIQDDQLIAASESNALVNCGFTDFKSLEPGKMIHTENGDITIKRFAKKTRKAHCMFEWVYFANVSSVMDGKSVYVTRNNLGKELARLETVKPDKDSIVVPVPDSARAAADAFAYELGVPLVEGLIRNRFVGRTFIEGTKRKDKIKSKYTILKEILQGKKIYLVDDSVVRGATTEQLVRSLKEEGGAKEVHVRVSCPPIMGPCFYGIDMSTVTELIAPRFMKEPEDKMPDKSADKMAEYLGADSVIYQTIPGLIKSIGLPKEDLCMACINREYPTPTGQDLIKIAVNNFETGKKETSRIYESARRVM